MMRRLDSPAAVALAPWGSSGVKLGSHLVTNGADAQVV